MPSTLSKCEIAIDSCCLKDLTSILTGEFLPCFDRNGCDDSIFKILGKEVCSSIVLNAINDKKKLGNIEDGGMRSEENFKNFENFDFTELDIRIEGKLNENDEVFDAYVYLFEDVKISIKKLLEERYNRKFKDMKFIEVQRNENTNEISNIFISFGKADKVPLVEFLSKKYF